MKIKFSLVSLLFILPLSCSFADNTDNTYPTSDRLFHISRSANKNLVCYDVNQKGGRLNTAEPLKVYWVNREEQPGVTNGLNYVQRKFAYGYKVISSQENRCVCALSAYSKRPITITKSKQKFICYVKINQQEAILTSLYVKANPHNPLKVEYVEIHGVSLSTHQAISERINN